MPGAYTVASRSGAEHELRGAERTDRGIGLVGMKMYYVLATSQLEALRHHVELMLFAGLFSTRQNWLSAGLRMTV